MLSFLLLFFSLLLISPLVISSVPIGENEGRGREASGGSTVLGLMGGPESEEG